MTTDRGTLRIARRLCEHPVLDDGPYCPRSAWLWILKEAAWARRTVVPDGEPVEIERGELAVSIRYLAQKWQWSQSRVFRFIAKLKRCDMLSSRTAAGHSTAGISVFRVVNFDRWQPSSTRNDPGTAPGTATGTTPNARNAEAIRLFAIDGRLGETTTETGGERNPEQKHIQHNKRKNLVRPATATPIGWPDDAFDAWYALYPRKKARQSAVKAFAKLQASGGVSLDKLMAATAAVRVSYDAAPTDQRQFFPYPASWLNSGSYDDEPDTPQSVARDAITAPERRPEDFTDGEWRERLAMFAKGSAWPVAYWGPKPGDPGCLVPQRILVGREAATCHG